MDNNLNNQIIQKPNFRKELARKNHMWFFNLYFSEYVKYETAPFQKQLFLITEDPTVKMAVICAFRNSGKSTIFTLSYPIWAILGEPKKKFVILLSQTQQQARLHLTNIKRELESNDVLRNDLGPFHEESDEWGSVSLVIPKHNARITAASCEQSIRGMRHAAHRPDLIIADDVEDLSSVKTKEGRDKIFNWFTGEVIPCGDQTTQVIVVGNLLHEDSLLMRLKNLIENNKLDGVFKAFPLVDQNDRILWLGKFPNMEAIGALKRVVGNEIAWQREYLLRIVPDVERVVHTNWIQYYDKLPVIPGNDYSYTGTGIDLAISLKDTADYTAMVTARVYGYESKMKIYILPNPINERLDFPQTLEKVQFLSKAVSPDGRHTELYIEEVGYQGALIQALDRQGYVVEGVKVANQDKRARLALVTFMIKSGQVLFPKEGCEALISQLVNFGIEKHDDLADAFAILLLKIMDKNEPMVEFCFVGCDMYGDDDDDDFDDCLPKSRGPWRRIYG